MTAGNQALNVNANVAPDADYQITTKGSDWYWAVCAIMTLATFAFAGLGHTKPRSGRIFHYITAGITMVAAIAYFTMGSGLGQTPIAAEFNGHSYNAPAGGTREIFYVRYIDWAITTPLLLLDLLLTAALPTPTVLFVILVDEVMIVTGLVGALTSSVYKWAYFVFGCVALFYVLYVLIFEARRNASLIGADVGRAFLTCGSLTSFLWLLYPIAWGLCEGGNVVSPDAEAGMYGFCDVLAKPLFGALLLFGHRGIDPARLGLTIQDYTGGDTAVKGHHRHETGVANGTTATTTSQV